MKRLIGVYYLSELEALIQGIPNGHLMHGVMLKVVNTYMQACGVSWFGCRRQDWYEIGLMTVQQSYRVRNELGEAGKLVYHSYQRPGAAYSIPVIVYTTLDDPPSPRPENVHIYQPMGED